jgi:tetratricopeptide (TPR) repeat protein
VAALVALAAVSLTRSESAAAGDDSAAELARLADGLAAVQAQQRDLRAALDAVALQAGGSAPAVSAADIDAAVARWLEGRDLAGLVPPAAQPAAVAAADGELDLDATFESLLDPDLSWEDREALWKQVREAGLTDEMLARVEAFAAARPHDPDAQVFLGSSYLQKIYEVGNGPEAGAWAMKADGAFDAALALDDHHWDARFSKAVSLSFWPPMFGKQAEAINHFGTLIAQQEAGPPKPGHAQTYMWLGNLYLQQGKNDLAKQTYEQGLAKFPQDPGLLKQLGLVQ